MGSIFIRHFSRKSYVADNGHFSTVNRRLNIEKEIDYLIEEQ